MSWMATSGRLGISWDAGYKTFKLIAALRIVDDGECADGGDGRCRRSASDVGGGGVA